MDLFDKKVGEVSIESLLAEGPLQFYIPAYQRGYRWQGRQVSALLQDLDDKWTADQGCGEKYLLQPVVLKKCDGGCVVVDGQQRLTTLQIILREFLGNDPDGVVGKVWTISPQNEKDIDPLSDACRRNCAKVVRTRSDVRDKILRHLKDIVFVYYMLDSGEDEHQAFERLNAGKIGLTDAELIRALFIPQDNVWAHEIASEWEQIENSLHDDTFWYMFNSSEPETETRIDRLFKIVTGQEQTKVKGSAFWVIESSIKSVGEDSHDCIWWWNEVMNVYWMLHYCYDNIKLYHYLGWFAHITDVQFGRIYNLYQRDRVNFGRNLQRNILGISNDLKCNPLYLKDEKLGYDFRSSNGGFRYLHPYANDDDYPSCFLDKDGCALRDIRVSTKDLRSFLLVFNLEILNQCEKCAVRFPFKTYKEQKWEIEHIASHNQSADPKIVPEKLMQDEKNMLWNLALLDKATNCTYKDKPFHEKRQYIFGLDGKNVSGQPFVPIGTREVFSKAYSKNPGCIISWCKLDAADYLEYMTIVFKRMWDDAEGKGNE